jgi:hypothetical protein
MFHTIITVICLRCGFWAVATTLEAEWAVRKAHEVRCPGGGLLSIRKTLEAGDSEGLQRAG